MTEIIDHLFYQNCILVDWQMTDSERMALKTVLDSVRPSCSLEIGTFRGGSLSLIRQYSTHTISLDIDPMVHGLLSRLDDVEFVTGDSGQRLAGLLGEISRKNFDLQFILLDGDHSKEGVKRDLNILLASIRPTSRTVLLLHDTFNSQCRQGMIEAEWGGNKYLQFVDLDFIPGRLIERLGPGCGELWGG